MKMTAAEILAAHEGVTEILKERLNAHVLYKFTRIAKTLGAEIESIEAQRKALVEKYGEKDGDGYRVPEDKIAEFRTEYEAVLATEVDVAIEPVRISPIANCELPGTAMLKAYAVLEE